jgi:6-phospho 3-hexuloisomerase
LATMNTIDYCVRALKEIRTTILKVDKDETETLIESIRRANRIFVSGSGRTFLMLKAFAMRMMHLGYTVYVVGEIVTPAIAKGDLLLVGSGSGETQTVAVVAKQAKACGASVAAITIFPDSTIAGIADFTVQIPGKTTKRDSGVKSMQPGGNLFEQSLLIVLDGLIARLNESARQGIDSGFPLHANLE